MKKYFLLRCALSVLIPIIPICCMNTDWSTYFKNLEEKFQKSFIFETKDPNKKIVLIETDQENTYVILLEKNDSDIRLTKIRGIGCRDGISCKIQCHIPYAYNGGNDETYTIYIASLVDSKIFFLNDLYKVIEVTININKKKAYPKPLFEQSAPIMHLGMVEKEDRLPQYLVAGSFYPLIEMYDVKTGTFVLDTIYKNFLLGVTKKSLLFLHKEKNNARYSGFKSSLDMEYQGDIVSVNLQTEMSKKRGSFLENLLKKIKGDNDDYSYSTSYGKMKINKDSYPLSITNGSSIVLLDKKANNIVVWQEGQEKMQSLYIRKMLGTGSVKNILYVDKNSILLQTDKEIFKIDLTALLKIKKDLTATKDAAKDAIKVIYKNAHDIENIFTINNTLWAITKTGCQKLVTMQPESLI